jgi:hypothetical protein
VKPFHRLTAHEFYAYCRRLFKSLPPIDWSDIQEGQMVVSGTYAYVVERAPPKRGYLMVYNALDKDRTPIRLSRKDHKGRVKVGTSAFRRIMNLDHRLVVEKALKAGKIVPARVQYDYPALFSPVPTDWNPTQIEKMKEAFSRLNEMRAFHDHQQGEGQWQIQKLDECITACRNDVRRWQEHKEKVAATDDPASEFFVKPDFRAESMASYQKLADEAAAAIPIYEYLQRHCQNTFPQPVS